LNEINGENEAPFISVVVNKIGGLNTLQFLNFEISETNDEEFVKVQGEVFVEDISVDLELTGFWGATGSTFHHLHEAHGIFANFTLTAKYQDSYPLIQNIQISDFHINSPLQATLPIKGDFAKFFSPHADFAKIVDLVDQAVPGVLNFPSRLDQNVQFKEMLKWLAQTLWIDKEEPWIPIGDVLFTCEDLVNHLIGMNSS
jgi:hypothetical protein